jgi:hypothetical protein
VRALPRRGGLRPRGRDFDHARSTGFPVDGAHAESTCEACHAPTALADGAGRTFGTRRRPVRESAAFREGSGCATCHADPHGGHFAEELGFPSEVEGKSDCARCHVESSFRTLRREFDHGHWTGFALAGAHEDATCSACHAPLRAPRAPAARRPKRPARAAPTATRIRTRASSMSTA